VKSSLSKSSLSSSELRRVPGTDCEGRPLLLKNDAGGDVTWLFARLPRGVVMPGLIEDMLKRFGLENAEGKPLPSLYSGGVVGWLWAGCLPYRRSVERRWISSSPRRDCKSMSSISASKRRRCSFKYSYSSFFFSSCQTASAFITRNIRRLLGYNDTCVTAGGVRVKMRKDAVVDRKLLPP